MVRTSIQHEMPRPGAIFLGDADAEPAVLRERGDEFLRKPSVVVTFQPVVVTKAAGYAGNAATRVSCSLLRLKSIRAQRWFYSQEHSASVREKPRAGRPPVHYQLVRDAWIGMQTPDGR